jgi:thioredoxin reductase
VQTIDGTDADTYDVIVIGGGPAGLAAATWLGRYRRRTLVLDSGEYRNRSVLLAHGVLGADPVDPMALLDRARGDLTQYPQVTLRRGEVTGLRRAGDRIVVSLADRELMASRLVLATGVRDELPQIAGFERHYGRDVFHCPACEGYDATGRAVAVIGWGAHIPPFAVQLLDTAARVRIVTDHDEPDITAAQRELLAEHGVEVTVGRAARLRSEEQRLEGIELHDGTVIPAALAFFSIEHHPVVDLARQLGCRLDADGHLEVDGQGLTSVAGVYAAGDVTPGMQLVSVAAAQGAIAGISCATSLRGEHTVPGAPDPAPDPTAFVARH